MLNGCGSDLGVSEDYNAKSTNANTLSEDYGVRSIAFNSSSNESLYTKIFSYYTGGMLDAIQYNHPNGYIAKTVNFTADGIPKNQTEYDENGNWIKSVSYNSEGEVFTYGTMEWDENGNAIGQPTFYNGDGTIRP